MDGMKRLSLRVPAAKAIVFALASAALSGLVAGCANGPISANSGSPAAVAADKVTQDSAEAPDGDNSSLDPTVDPAGPPPDMDILPR